MHTTDYSSFVFNHYGTPQELPKRFIVVAMVFGGTISEQNDVYGCPGGSNSVKTYVTDNHNRNITINVYIIILVGFDTMALLS